MSDMAACAAFIRDRVSECEQAVEVARNYATGPIGGSTDEAAIAIVGENGRRLWSTDDLLAQVAAMRAILLDYRNVEGTLSALEESDDPARFEWAEQERTLDRTLRHLAAIWSSHPEYEPAWAPDA